VKTYITAVAVVASICGGCAYSTATPGIVGIQGSSVPKGDEIVVRGVVNGLRKFDPEATAAKLKKKMKSLGEDEISALSQQYVVRVGINRAPEIPIPIGWLVLSASTGKAAERVFLPESWSFNVTEISTEPNVINVGDVVDIRVQKNRHYNFLVSILRKCYEDPLEDENPDWNIGCHTYTEDDWGSDDYIGKSYLFTRF